MIQRLWLLLDHPRWAVRLGAAYLWFFLFLGMAYGLGWVFPAGALRSFPALSSVTFPDNAPVGTRILATVGYNLFLWGLIVGANLFRVRRFSFGYLPLFANTLLLGLFAGSDAFQGTLSSRALEGWRAFFRIGFVEFSAYIFACVFSVPLTRWVADRWRHTSFRPAPSSLSTSQIKWIGVGLVLSLGLLLLAAWLEWAPSNP